MIGNTEHRDGCTVRIRDSQDRRALGEGGAQLREELAEVGVVFEGDVNEMPRVIGREIEVGEVVIGVFSGDGGG